MGVLRRRTEVSGQPLRMTGEVRIGRGPDNDLIVARPSVSGRHAVIRWVDGSWILRDASKHGTLVNGQLVKGASARLAVGDVLTFVEDDEVWCLEDASPPGLLLRPVNGSESDEIYVDAGALHAFPSREHPNETIFQIGDAWIHEAQSGVRTELRDGSRVNVLGVEYMVSAPREASETTEPRRAAASWSLDCAELSIVVFRGEDEAELTISSGAAERTVKASRPLYLLAYLAEQRIKEAPEVSASDAGHGWIPLALACSDLGVDRQVLNVDVHRVREAVKSTGLGNAANVIERRPNQIRIGVPADRVRVTRG